MAKTAHGSHPQTIVVRQKEAPTKHKTQSRFTRRGKTGSSPRGGTLVLVGAASVALLDKAQIPTIPVLGKTGTMALAAYIYARHTGSRDAMDVAIGMASIAVYTLIKEGKVSGEEL